MKTSCHHVIMEILTWASHQIHFIKNISTLHGLHTVCRSMEIKLYTHPVSAAFGWAVVNPEHTDVLTLSVYTHLHKHRQTEFISSVSQWWPTAQLHPNKLTWSSKYPHSSKQGGKVSHTVYVSNAIQSKTHLLLYNSILLILWCQGNFQLCQDVTNEATLSSVNNADFIHDSVLSV